MVTLEQIADAALARESLLLRSLVQDFLRQHEDLSVVPRPSLEDPRRLAAAAAILEVLALRRQQESPPWTREVGPMPKPFFLVEASERMSRLRQLCETQAPEPMRRRRLYAPPNFLVFA